MLEVSDAILIAGGTGLTSAAASWAAIRVTLSYMKRDIIRAQYTANRAHDRIDNVLGIKGGRRVYDPPSYDNENGDASSGP